MEESEKGGIVSGREVEDSAVAKRVSELLKIAKQKRKCKSMGESYERR